MVKVWISIQNIVFRFVLLLWVKEIGSLVSYFGTRIQWNFKDAMTNIWEILTLSCFTCYHQCVSNCDSPNEYTK